MPWRTWRPTSCRRSASCCVYRWQRWRRRAAAPAPRRPSVRAISATFGNSVQLGIPLAAALFGEAGLAIHIALVSLHALILLTVLTVLVELDLARAARRPGQRAQCWPTLRTTVRNTVVHPVVLPVLAGLLWNATGWACTRWPTRRCRAGQRPWCRCAWC
jgi:malonate transporter and related proteins